MLFKYRFSILFRFRTPRARFVTTPAAQHHQRTTTTSARESWTQSDQDRLIRLINTKYRDTIHGNWDAITQHLKETATNHRHPWTDAELAKLNHTVTTGYLSAGRHLNWTKIARSMGRSPAACFHAFYQHSKSDQTLPSPVVITDPISKHSKWSTAELTRLDKAIEKLGPTSINWHQVADIVKTRSHSACLSCWYRSQQHQQPQQQKPNTAHWSTADLARLRTTLAHSPHYSRLIPTLARLFPDKPLSEIRAQLHRTRASLAYSSFAKWSPAKIQALQDAVTAQRQSNTNINWHQVAQKVGGISSSMCQIKYEALAAKTAARGCKRWTDAELQLLDNAVADMQRLHGKVSWPEVARRVRSKTTKQCYNKWYRSSRSSPTIYP